MLILDDDEQQAKFLNYSAQTFLPEFDFIPLDNSEGDFDWIKDGLRSLQVQTGSSEPESEPEPYSFETEVDTQNGADRHTISIRQNIADTHVNFMIGSLSESVVDLSNRLTGFEFIIDIDMETTTETANSSSVVASFALFFAIVSLLLNVFLFGALMRTRRTISLLLEGVQIGSGPAYDNNQFTNAKQKNEYSNGFEPLGGSTASADSKDAFKMTKS